jgi:hypothetical protein
MITDRSQRWRERRDRFVSASSTINPAEYSVDIIDCMKVAKPFVVREHYSGSFPASRLSVGLFRNGRGGTPELVGVATFSVPMNNAAVVKHAGLTHYNHGADLGRFVLLDSVPGNGETFFLSKALRALRQEKPEIISIISYADPMERRAPDGSLVKPGHVGSVYRVMQAQYRGRCKPRMEMLTPDGQLFSERAISKIRNHETGIGYAVDELVRRGAPPPAGDERAWLEGLVAAGFFTKRRHNGNHIYVFPLTKAAKLATRFLPQLDYPVLDRNPNGGDVTALPLLKAA